MQNLQTPISKHQASQESLRMPDFFIIGSPKCGTTTLYTYLCRHPNVFMSTPKEMSFFSKDEVYERGMQWYADLFADATPDQRCGEASTTYSRWPYYEHTAERLAEAQPEAKLIYVVREPVARLYSFYAHRMREKVTQTFDDFLASTPEAIDSGHYMSQIKQYLQVFSRDQLLVLFTQDLQTAPGETLNKVRTFLELPEYDFVHQGSIHTNQGGGNYYAATSLTESIRQLKRSRLIAAMLKMVPSGTRKLGYEWLAHGPVGERLKKRHREGLCSITPQLRHQIQQLYRAEVEQLEAYTGRSLASWKGDVE